MTKKRLYDLLELPPTVTEKLTAYDEASQSVLTAEIEEMLLSRETWEQGVAQLRERIGEESDGMKILSEMLGLACKSYRTYQEKGIPESIFIATMKFCTRFIEAYHSLNGGYKFEWDWWFPRQLSLKEFRIGCLEYEFVEGNENLISVHIPADADFRPQSVTESLHSFFAFRDKYFPQWQGAKLYCESWLLSPALKEILAADSNILHFQNRFVVESSDYESLAVLDWVFPRHHEISEQLPEKTSLQKSMKKFMLGGGKIGWSKGYLSAPDQSGL